MCNRSVNQREQFGFRNKEKELCCLLLLTTIPLPIHLTFAFYVYVQLSGGFNTVGMPTVCLKHVHLSGDAINRRCN